jgi:hypothetical protein
MRCAYTFGHYMKDHKRLLDIFHALLLKVGLWEGRIYCLPPYRILLPCLCVSCMSLSHIYREPACA